MVYFVLGEVNLHPFELTTREILFLLQAERVQVRGCNFWPDRLFSFSTYLSPCICLKTLHYRLALNIQESKKRCTSLTQRAMQETVPAIPSHQVEQELVQGMKGQQNRTSSTITDCFMAYSYDT